MTRFKDILSLANIALKALLHPQSTQLRAENSDAERKSHSLSSFRELLEFARRRGILDEARKNGEGDSSSNTERKGGVQIDVLTPISRLYGITDDPLETSKW